MNKLNKKGNIIVYLLGAIAVLSSILVTISATNAERSKQAKFNEDRQVAQSYGKEKIIISASMLEQESASNLDVSNTNDVNELLKQNNVKAYDVTSLYAPTANNIIVYELTYPIENPIISRKVYFTSSGDASSSDTNSIYDFSIASNSNLLLNGGSLISDNVYSKNTYVSPATIYKNDSNYEILNSSKPAFNNVTLFSNNSYGCYSNCYDILSDNNLGTINISNKYFDSNYFSTNIEGNINKNPSSINTFFGDFNYDNYLLDLIISNSPSDGKTIEKNIPNNIEYFFNNKILYTDWSHGSCTWSTTCYNAPNSTYFNSNKSNVPSFIYSGNLTLNHRLETNDYYKSWGIFDGDINFRGGRLSGNYLINGDLTFDGSKDISLRGVIYVLGDLYIRMSDKALKNYFNDELFIFTKGNVYIQSHTSNTALKTFIYSEENIIIDNPAVELNIEGGIYALAKNNLNTGYIQENILTNTYQNISGIIINSHRGKYNNQWIGSTNLKDSLFTIGKNTNFIIENYTYEETVPQFTEIISTSNTGKYFVGYLDNWKY